ncbi:GntR family transcriptional regulator [Thermosyntropha lipolytica DSM 11003]|uniref:GntR family transcriptional regulator n=1 Tax=Thermosyntropha lipolytica DSM 11003 TaxID=1123382 RepID=A0A1M5M717_9FIRM|nr:GntR family transcriptional regulator [Thermosyntropha lipolytica]SHG73048.1 GntR family transcriptional regulator [Thermosyntropha lipolytica DSM 11003]
MFELDFRSRKPIYEQLVEKIKDLIVNEVLKPDEKLPPVRVLAADLAVNPNTVQKAYRELERMGYIYSIPGKGNYVGGIKPGEKEGRIRELKEELKKIVLEMLFLGLTGEEIEKILDEIKNLEGGKEVD